MGIFSGLHRKNFSVNQIIALVFGGIILLGAILLTLPFAAKSGHSCGFVTALFTAASATCVTGLALADTWTMWSVFGQVVILLMIEIGGLGFMSAASVLVFALRREIDMRYLLLMAQSIGEDDMNAVVKVQKRIISLSLLIEAVGAVILSARFHFKYKLKHALWLGVFHSVSAFCNAGFDIMGFETPGGSMGLFIKDVPVCITLSLLIIVGGIGFIVWDDILHSKNPRKWSVYTKLVLGITGILLVGGTVAFMISEFSNPATIGGLSPVGKLNAAFFQSVTTRTAGFAVFDQGALSEPGKAVTMLLMFIGGSSGSTAGGMKTVTFLVLLVFLASRVTGRKRVVLLERTVTDKHIMDALTVFCIMISLCFIGAVVVSADTGVCFADSLFEAISALATVGLSTGITSTLGLVSKLLITAYMYIGRVGILTISIGFLQNRKRETNITYPSASLLIG